METIDAVATDEPPPEEEALDLTPVKEALNSYPKTRRYLIPILQKTQAAYRYLPEAAMELVQEELGLSKAQVYGVISFYSQLLISEPGKYILKLCTGTACFVKGAPIISDKIYEKYHIKKGETDEKKLFTLQTASCMGNCGAAPILMIGEDCHGNVDPELSLEMLATYENKED